MKTLTRKITAILSGFLKNQRQRLVRRALESEIAQTFRRLESRRVLSVTAVFGGGVLDITIANDGLGTDAALLTTGANFFVDADGSNTLNGAEVSGLMSSLHQINVNGAAGVGSFLWRGDFSSAGGIGGLNGLAVQNVDTAVIDTTAVLKLNADIAAASSVSFRTSLAVNGDLTTQASGAGGLISNAANALLIVDGNAHFTATTITLGSAANDSMQFGSLTFNSTGGVSVVEDGSSVLVGASSVGSLSISATGANADIQINGSVLSSLASGISIISADSISFGAAGSLNANNLGNILLTANADLLNGNSNDIIFMADGSAITADQGAIRLSALGVDGGDITLGRLFTNSAAVNAITIQTTGSILDGTAGDTLLDANLLAANGTINLSATNGSVGLGAAVADIDINGLNLIFNANSGVVQITDLIGGVKVSGISRAGLGGFLAVNSPLTISADIFVGGSFAFTAGNDFLLPIDHLTIDSGAVVTLTSLVAQTLTFNAGDNIDFNSGRIVTTGGGVHSVILNADLDGGADGLRGQILQNGTPTVEVTTDNLITNSANGINLDTEVATLTASNNNTGNIVIQDLTGISLLAISNTGGAVDVSAAAGNVTIGPGSVTASTTVTISTPSGSITDAQDDVLVDITAGGLITLNARDAIGGLAVDGRLDLAAGSDVFATSTTGIISLRGLGALTLTNVVASAGTVDVVATGAVTATLVSASGAGNNVSISTTTGGIAATSLTAANNVILSATAGDITSGTITATTGSVAISASAGDVTIGSIVSGTTVSILTPLGSINDAQNDAIADITAGGVITLNARDEIAGLAADGRLDFAAGSIVSAISTSGNILLQGVGALTLTNIQALAGLIDVVAVGTINAVNVDSATIDALANSTTLRSTAGNILVQTVRAGTSFGDVSLRAFGSILDNDSPIDNLDVSGNNVTLTADTGSIGSITGNIFCAVVNVLEVTATNNLTATAVAGLVALDATVGGVLTLTTSAAWLQSNGDLDATGLILPVTNLALIADADKNGSGELKLGASLTILGDLRLEGFDVSAADGSIDLTASRLMFVSGQTETIRVFDVDQLDATANGDLTIVSTSLVKPLELIDLNCDNVAVQTLSSTGTIDVSALTTIIVTDDIIAGNDGVLTSSGNILLSANALTADVLIKDLLLTDAGSIEVRSFRNIQVGGPISLNELLDTDNTFTITTIQGNVRLVADADGTLDGSGGKIDMLDGSKIIAGRTPIAYVPNINGLPSPTPITLGVALRSAGSAEITLLADGNITVGSLQTKNTGSSAIAVTSFNGGIIDSGDATSDANFIANDAGALVTLNSVLGAGNTNPLETNAFQLTAINTTGVAPGSIPAAGSIRILETAAGGDLNLVIAVRNDATFGDIQIQVDGGNLTVDGPISNQMGNILVKASTDVTINQNITSLTGHITVSAGDDVLQNANIGTGGVGTIYIEAGNLALGSTHDVIMSSTATTTTFNQNIVIDANGSIALGVLDAGTGNVSLRAAESITDAKANNVTNVTANIFRMIADSDSNGTGIIGGNDLANTADQNVNAIDTQVVTIAARSAQGIYIRETDAIRVGDSATINVTQVNFNAATTIVADPNIGLAGLVTTVGGPIKLQALSGDLIVDNAVSANGVGAPPANGDVLLQTLLFGQITINAAVSSATGFISIKSAGDVTLNGSLTGIGNGVLITSPGNITLGSTIDAGGGDVSLRAGTSISNTLGETTNITANNLQMIATTGSIGLPNKLNPDPARNTFAIGTRVNLMAASSATGIYVREFDGAVIGDTGSLAFTSVNFNSTRAASVVPGLSGMTTTAGGPILVQSLTGDLVVDSRISALGSADVDGDGIIDGDVLLQTLAASGDITVNATITTAVGHVSLKSFDDILLNSSITTGGAGTVYLESGRGVAGTTHDVLMSATATVNTVNQNVAVVANGNIALGSINAGTGDVSLTAAESITDAKADNTLNITARNLRMVADSDANGIGFVGASDLLNTPNQNVNAIDTSVVLLAAQSAQGTYIRELNDVTVGDTGAITVKQVQFNSTTVDVTAAAIAGLRTTTGGPIKLQSVAGNMVVDRAVDANGAGDVLLQTLDAGSVTLNNTVQSGTGNISVKAFDDIHMNSTIATGGAGTVYLETGLTAPGSTHDIVMAAGTSITTADQNIALVANGKIDLRVINAGTGNVSLTAAESINDAKADNLVNITARNLRMIADSDANGTGSMGASDLLNTPDQNINAIDTAVTLIAARSAQGIYIREANDVVVGDTGPITVKQVNFNSTSPDLIAPALTGFATIVDGPIKLQSVAGNIVVNQAISANGVGDVLVQALTAGSVTLNAAVLSSTGHISIKAFEDILLNSSISTGGAGTVYLESGRGVAGTTHDVLMSATATVNTVNQNVAVVANGNIALGSINAGTGDVSLTAAESITDAKADNTLNITARNLRMVADSDANGTGFIGASDLLNTPNQNVNAIDTSVVLLAAQSAQGTYIRELNDVTVGDTGAITVKQVQFNSTTADVTAAAIAGLRTTPGGPIKLQIVAGNLIVNEAVNANGAGDVLLQTLDAGSVTLNSTVQSGTGNISVKAFDDILMNSTIPTGGAGTVYLETGLTAPGSTHDIVMAAGSSITTVNQNITLVANGKIDLRVISAGTGDVSLMATESINDAKADNLVNITARNLRMIADSDTNGTGSIGASDLLNMSDENVNAIDTAVTLVAARSAQGIYIREANDIVVGDTGPITVKQVNFNSTSPDLTAPALTGLSTTLVGPIKLQSVAGNIVVSQALSAGGVGDVLVQTLIAGSVTLNEVVQSDTGHISIKSFDDILLNSSIATGGTGTVYLESGKGVAGTTHDVLMSATATVTTVNQNVAVVANGNIALGRINVGTGNVSLTAAESITDAKLDNTLNITARNLRLVADSDANGTGKIGDDDLSDFKSIDTSVVLVSASSAQGIYLREVNDVIVGDSGVITVKQVHFNSTTADIVAPSLSGLITTQLGPIKLQSIGGNLSIDSNVSAGPSSLADVALKADVTLKSLVGHIDEGTSLAHVEGRLLTIVVGTYAHLHDTRVAALDATVISNGALARTWQTVNTLASDRGDDFLNNLTTIANPTLDSALSSTYRFGDKYSGQYALYLVNSASLTVNNISAGPSASPNVYVATTGSSDLRISGPVITKSTTVDAGGIVLIGGRDLILDVSAAAKLETQTTLYTQTIEQIGLDVTYLNGRFFDAGEGIEPNSTRLTTTRYVVPIYSGGSTADIDFQTHVYQKVVLQFGNVGEAGFVTIVGYADKNYELFDTAGDQGTRAERSSNAAPITNFPLSPTNAAVFTRSVDLSQFFLLENQLLPTDAIVRRAPDFFLFENGSAVTAAGIKDLAFEAASIDNVTSQGGLGGSVIPPDVQPAKAPIPGTFTVPIDIAPPPFIKPPEIELVSTLERVKEITVYRVIYNDIDRDGQADPDELPSSDDVLKQVSKPGDNDTLGQKFDKLKATIPTKDSLSPTPAEIEAFKAGLRADPESPSGAYAIVEKGQDGKEQVLEVFAVRDWEEKKTEDSNELPIVPLTEDPPNVIPDAKPPANGKPNDEASLLQPSWQHRDDQIAYFDEGNGSSQQSNRTRLASAGLLFGSLWIVRETTKSKEDAVSPSILEMHSIGFSSSERRHRRLRTKLGS